MAEGSLLDTFLRTWLRGLTDNNIKRKCAEYMGATDRSLRMLYDAAESARRINLEVQKLFEDETKESELRFYKEIAQRNMPETQINALLASYQAKAHGRDHSWEHNDYQTSPPYRSERAPPFVPHPVPTPQGPLMPSTNRANQGHPLPERRPRNYQPPIPKSVPNRNDSSNPWVNGSRTYDAKRDGRLCVKYGTLGHIPKDCAEEYLPAWEQTILKEIVFGPTPQVSSAVIGWGSYYNPPSSRESLPQSSQPSRESVYTPSTSESTKSAPPTPFLASPLSNSVHFGTAGLREAIESKSAEAMLGEGSGPNKRPHIEEPITSPPQAQQIPNNLSGPTFQSGHFQERATRKGKKRVGRKIELQPVVGQLSDDGSYDSPISVRQALQSTKIEMTWMDLVAWSPAACRELKRLCTRVPKKRTPKASATKQPQQPQAPQYQQGMPQFNYHPIAQFPQPMPSYMMPPQVPPTMSGGLQQNPTQLQNTQSTGTVASATVSRLTPAQAEERAVRHTRLLITLVEVDKAFRIQCTIYKPDGTVVVLEQKLTQADQGSEMNVISAGLARFLGLVLHSLEEVGFKGLSMRTADHRETILHHWVWLRVSVEGIVRDIRCFVAPELPHTTSSGEIEYLSLILGIPWLYSVDGQISVRQSRILVGDASIGEQVRAVTGPELVFCKDHNLLMYPKNALPRIEAIESDDESPEEEDAASSSEASSSDESEEDDAEELDAKVPPFQ